MNLENELSQLQAYYQICNYEGKLVCGALISGAEDILAGRDTTIDAYSSNREELERRISGFYASIDTWLIVDY